MKTTVEINGRKYDAKTGKVLKQSVVTSSFAKTTATALKKPLSLGKNIDGIAHKPQNHQNNTAKQHTASTPKPTQRSVIHSRTSAKPVRRTIEKSKTLVRTAVKKPQPIAGIHSTSAMISTPKTAPLNYQPALNSLASRVSSSVKQVAQNPNISHFGTMTKNSFTKVVSNIGVSVPPNNLEASPPLIFNKKRGKNKEKPQVFNHRAPKHNYQTASNSPSEKLAKRLSRRVKINPRTAAICISILAILFLGSFLAYQKMPQVAIKVAARGAGFNGRLPEDIPAGYSFKGPVEYREGYIALHYKSNSDNREFTITQQPKTWTSDSLLTNYIEANDLKYQTSISNGLRVFVFNEGNATWVDKGVWFNITGEGSLSSDQILNIASSF